jgi:hypothetical protein
MNQYRDLVAKLEAIQNRTSDMAGPEVAASECGDMPTPHGRPEMGGDDELLVGEEQRGSATVNVRDLITALQSIEQGVDEVAEEITAPMAAMVRTGNDLASKGKEAPKRNGGGNPMQESLIQRLSEHYNEVKAR